MAGQNKASMRRKLRSALAHKRLADVILDQMVAMQGAWNSTLAKIDAEAGVFSPAVAATAVLDLTADITLTSVASGTPRNTNTFTIQVLAAAGNLTDTVLVDITGTAAAIVATVTPNDGTNNSATPVDLTTAELVELINTGAVVGKNITLADSNSLRALQTAAGGDTTALADAGEGDGVVGTFSGGLNAALASFDTNYVALGALSSLWDPEAILAGQSKATARQILRSALAHRKLADEIADAMVEMQVAYMALLTKLDAEAGTLNDGNYVSSLAVSVIDAEHDALPAQHKASARRSLQSALANKPLADSILDAMSGIQDSFNSALALLDTANVTGVMAALEVPVIAPDAE